MSKNKLRSRDAIEEELKKTKVEFTIANQSEMKLRNKL